MTIIKVKDIPITSRSGRIYNTSNLTINNSSSTTGGGSTEVDLSNYLNTKLLGKKPVKYLRLGFK